MKVLTRTLPIGALTIVLMAGGVAGGAIWYMERAATAAERAVSRFELPRLKEDARVLFGREGTIMEKHSGYWSVQVDSERGSDELVQVMMRDDTEYFETRIANQLPKLPDGSFDHSKAFVIRKIAQDDFEPGHAVYVVARENILKKKELSVFRVYKIVYE